MSQINQVIQEWVGQGRAFTAYEVTLEARNRGASGRHKDMRSTIHQDAALKDAVSFGGYEQSNVDVGTGIMAILYHPDTFDPTNYQPLARGGNTPVVNTPAPTNATPNAPTTSPVSSSGLVHNLDHRNRLFVQKRYLSDIGVNAGELVSIFKEGDALLVRKNKTGDSPLTTLKVERDGEIRISQATLIAAGLTNTNFTIEVSGDVIEIEDK